MYRELTVNTPGCVAFSLPCGAGAFKFRRFQRFPAPSLQPAQRAAKGRGRASPSGVRSQATSVPGTVQNGGTAPISGPRGDKVILGERASAPNLGRRRQTKAASLSPSIPDGPTLDAPDSIADQNPGPIRGHAERQLRSSCPVPGFRFGSAPLLAFRSSPHPRIRWTVASPGSAARALGSTRPPPPRVYRCQTKC